MDESCPAAFPGAVERSKRLRLEVGRGIVHRPHVAQVFDEPDLLTGLEVGYHRGGHLIFIAVGGDPSAVGNLHFVVHRGRHPDPAAPRGVYEDPAGLMSPEGQGPERLFKGLAHPWIGVVHLQSCAIDNQF